MRFACFKKVAAATDNPMHTRVYPYITPLAKQFWRTLGEKKKNSNQCIQTLLLSPRSCVSGLTLTTCPNSSTQRGLATERRRRRPAHDTASLCPSFYVYRPAKTPHQSGHDHLSGQFQTRDSRKEVINHVSNMMYISLPPSRDHQRLLPLFFGIRGEGTLVDDRT